MAEVGKVNDLTKEFNFEWKIDNFLSLSEENSKSYNSPWFSLADELWYLKIYPNGDPEDNAIGYISVYLFRDLSDPPVNLLWSFGLKTFDGKKVHEEQHACAFDEEGTVYGSDKLLKRSTLLERKSELIPSDILTIVFTVEYFSKSNNGGGKTATVKCSHCKVDFFEECYSSHEQKCLDKLIRCPTCSAVVALREWFDHKCQTVEVKGDLSLSQDFKKMLLDGKSHDLILKIGDKELRAHQDVLRARSQVFESMLNHDMKEKNSGVIDVPDCNPQAMELFLTYVYSGKVESLDQSNMLGLYYIADKYNMQSLKEDCCDFIKKTLSHTNICEVIQLALNHSDTGLLEYVTEYFTDNVLDIMVTVEWQSFLKDNSTVGNELMFKSFRKIKNIKT